MSLYSERKNLFLQLSAKHYLVMHGLLMDGGIRRKSFLQIANEEEISAAVMNHIHMPAVVHVDFNGKPVDKNGSVRVRNNNVLMFLDKPVMSADNVSTTAANDAAYNRAFGVMMDFISFIWNEFEENGSCGPFKDIDLNLFSWTMEESVSDGLVGWRLSFADEVKATDITDFDEGKWLNVIVTEDGTEIITENGNNIHTN
jgi:hypothetical protein